MIRLGPLLIVLSILVLAGCRGARAPDAASDRALAAAPLAVNVRAGVAGAGLIADVRSVRSIRAALHRRGRAPFLPARVIVTRVCESEGYPGLLPFRCRLRGPSGRLVADRVIRLAFGSEAESTAPVDVSALHPRARRYSLEISLARAGPRAPELTARVEVPIRPPDTDWNGYHVFHWTESLRDRRGPLQRMGIEGAVAYRTRQADAAILDLSASPYYVENVLHYILAPDQVSVRPDEAAPLTRKPCLSDAAVRGAQDVTIEQHVKLHALRGPAFYSLGGEIGIATITAATDLCRGPRCMGRFREWLGRRYGSLNALNLQWATSFETWADVLPETTDQTLARILPKPQTSDLKPETFNASSWCDHRAFMDAVMADAIGAARDTFRALDPAARVGIVGAREPSAYGGYDYSRLLRALDVIALTPMGANVDLVRSLAPDKPALTMLFLKPDDGADSRRVDEHIHALWRGALHGHRGAILWEDGKGKGRLLAPGGEPTPLAEALAPTLRELSGGIVRLLSHAEPERAQIALHYSPASIRAHWMRQVARDYGLKWREKLAGNPAAWRKVSEHLRLCESWCKLLEDLGYAYDFVSTEQIEAGALSRYKALILPQSIAIGDNEADAIRSFADAGGILIQDGFAGALDEHGRARKTPVLDDLFGLVERPFQISGDRPTILRPAEPDLAGVRAKHLPSDTVFLPLPGALPLLSAQIRPNDKADRSKRVVLRKAPDLDDRPRITMEAPRSFTLNADLTDYLRWRLASDRDRVGMAQSVLLEALSDRVPRHLLNDFIPSGIFPLDPRGVKVFKWTMAGVTILAFLHNRQDRWRELGGSPDSLQTTSERPIEFTSGFANRGKHVFDVRTGEYIGRGPKKGPGLNVTLDPWQPRIFAVFDRMPKPGELRATKAVTPGQTIRFEDRTRRTRARVVRYRLLRPDNSDAPHASGSTYAANGRVRGQVPTYLGDPEGTWTLETTDVATGRVNRVRIEVRRPQAK